MYPGGRIYPWLRTSGVGLTLPLNGEQDAPEYSISVPVRLSDLAGGNTFWPALCECWVRVPSNPLGWVFPQPQLVSLRLCAKWIRRPSVDLRRSLSVWRPLLCCFHSANSSCLVFLDAQLSLLNLGRLLDSPCDPSPWTLSQGRNLGNYEVYLASVPSLGDHWYPLSSDIQWIRLNYYFYIICLVFLVALHKRINLVTILRIWPCCLSHLASGFSPVWHTL